MSTPRDEPERHGGESQSPQRAWTGRTRGGWFGVWFFITLVKLIGLRVSYAMLVPVVFWFWCFAPTARRASLAVLERTDVVSGPGVRAAWCVYVHLFRFGQALLDRVYALARHDHGFTFEVDGEDGIREALGVGRGVILVSAHFGGWEVASRAFGGLGTVVNIVAVQREKQHIQNLLDRHLGHRRFNVIAADGGAAPIMAMTAALRRGEIIALHGDRTMDHTGARCSVLGGDVILPTGPYMLAALCQSPLFHTLTIRQGFKRYRLEASAPLYLQFDAQLSRAAQLQRWAQDFADCLSQRVSAHPYQWFNFYDYWQDSDHDTDTLR